MLFCEYNKIKLLCFILCSYALRLTGASGDDGSFGSFLSVLLFKFY